MRQNYLDKINVYFEKWRGSNAFINSYSDENERLTIGFKQPGVPSNIFGMCFLHCIFLSGPTRWSNCDIRCRFFELIDGEIGFEIFDERGKFLLQCGGPVVIGDGEAVIPQS
jgi:hypothetical protein